MVNEHNNEYANNIVPETLDVDINDDIPLVNASLIERHVVMPPTEAERLDADVSLETTVPTNIDTDDMDVVCAPPSGGGYDETDANGNIDEATDDLLMELDGNIIDDFDNAAIETDFGQGDFSTMRTDLHQDMTQGKNESVISEIVKNIINRLS